MSKTICIVEIPVIFTTSELYHVPLSDWTKEPRPDPSVEELYELFLPCKILGYWKSLDNNYNMQRSFSERWYRILDWIVSDDVQKQTVKLLLERIPPAGKYRVIAAGETEAIIVGYDE